MGQVDVDQSREYFKVHNVKFYNPVPRQIKSLSYNKNTLKLAVSRDDASIEIWDMRAAVYMEKCILGQSSWSVEGLGWLDNRLFSTGLSGELIEWDLIELKPKKKVTLTGNGAHCLDIDDTNSCIAVGTVDGYMNTFWIDGDDLNFSKLFDKQEGAIFCCKYDSTGEHIVTGSTDNIRIWNVASGHAIHRMATGRSEKNRETNVWSLVVLKDLTILAGDSRGHITVWNGNDGTRIDSFEALDADVLAVAINHDETMFCCSGVDPKIKIFVPVRKENNSIRQWIRNLKRSQHDHDVKALTYIDREKFISGGVDGYITVSNSTKIHGFQPRRYGAFLPQPCAVVAVTARLLLLKYINYVEVWKLGRPNGNIQLNDDDHPGGKKFFAMDEKQEKLLHLQSVNHEPITCASISPDGMFLFYSTESKVRLFRLDKQTAHPTKVIVDSDKFTPCTKVLFSSDSKSMYCIKISGDVDIFSLSASGHTEFKATISTKEEISDTISIVCLSKCEQYFVCAGTCGTTAVWTNKKNRWSYYKTISKSKYAPTAMAIHNKSCRIVLAYSDYKILEYDLSKNVIVCATETSIVDKWNLRRKDTAIKNILLNENNEDIVILQNDSVLFSLEKDNAMASTKKRKPELRNDASSTMYYKLRTSYGNYEHFAHLSWLSSNELVAIVVNPETLIEQLPPSMTQRQFGMS